MRRFSIFFQTIVLLLLAINLAGCDVAKTGTDFVTLITHLQSQFPAVIKLISAVAYILGLGLVVRGIYALKVYGEARTMMSSHADLKTPLTYILVGTILIFSPTTINVAMQTVYGNQNILAYTGPNQTFGGFQFTTAFLYFVQVLGFVSFVRGWAMMAQLTKQSGHTTFGKAMTHIVGGILAMNIQATINVLQATFTGG